MRIDLVIAGVAALGFVAGSALTQAKDEKPKKEEKPRGACTITVMGVTPTCTSPMTLDSCNATAKKVGGVAEWKEGKTCPK